MALSGCQHDFAIRFPWPGRAEKLAVLQCDQCHGCAVLTWVPGRVGWIRHQATKARSGAGNPRREEWLKQLFGPGVFDDLLMPADTFLLPEGN